MRRKRNPPSLPFPALAAAASLVLTGYLIHDAIKGQDPLSKALGKIFGTTQEQNPASQPAKPSAQTAPEYHNYRIQQLPTVTITAKKPINALAPRYTDAKWAKEQNCIGNYANIHPEETREEIEKWCANPDLTENRPDP